MHQPPDGAYNQIYVHQPIHSGNVLSSQFHLASFKAGFNLILTFFPSQGLGFFWFHKVCCESQQKYAV